ncbi:toxin-antitoxin system YwqK family antitoxin [Shewanella psychrotolerans]|uniref:toxin-antitoxin system YwqK family antitoxin n=1 Tax=Shewanella psychrotolerans TaxID=2864206 RepID=UPI001C65F7DB|nr:hypothetical protein [Shewanella psychrotolerans]QYK02667.1 hypothetical protein K0I62_06910 [Shewanella psychrotolerans]
MVNLLIYRLKGSWRLLKVSSAALVSVFALTACNSKATRPIDEQELAQIECTTFERYGISFKENCLIGYQGQPFTGIMVSGDPASYFSATQYRDGKRDGFSFAAKGSHLSSQGWYINGLRDGEHIRYRDDSDKLLSREVYGADQKLAVYIYGLNGIIDRYVRYENGENVESIIYDKGREWMHTFIEEGEQRVRKLTYFDNESLKSTALFRNQDLKMLAETTYFADGKIRTQFDYDKASNGAQFDTYWPNGQRQSQQHYGYHPLIVLHGKQLSFCNSNGQLEAIRHYQMGGEHGVFKEFYCNGQHRVTKRYQQGIIIDKEVKTYSDTGHLLISQTLDGKGKVLQSLYYDESGQVTFQQ